MRKQLKALANKHWKEWLPEKLKKLRLLAQAHEEANPKFASFQRSQREAAVEPAADLIGKMN